MTSSRGSSPSEPSSEPVLADLSPGRQAPLVELRCASMYARRGSIALSVQRSRCAVSTALRSSRPRNLWRRAFVNRRRSTLALALSCRVQPSLTATERIGSSSRGVRSPSAPSVREARLPRVCLTRHLPTSGFLALLPACFFPNLPALFHAGSAHGVFPSGLFPLAEPSFPLGSGTFLALILTHVNSGKPEIHLNENLVFKVLLSARIRHPRARGEPVTEIAALLGFCWPLGISPSCRPAAHAADPLAGLAHLRAVKTCVPSAVRQTAPQGLDRLEVGWSLSRLPPLVVFCTLSPNRRF